MQLKSSSLEWGMRHVLRDGDTDLFPRPFELDLIKKYWADIKPDLEKLEINTHSWRGTRRLLVPKSDFSFRAISQLDPLDSILFASLIKEIGKKIERRRPPYSQKRVFSYRFDPSVSGRLYSENSGWEDFWTTTAANCESYDYVLVTDISDWYNQLYHHTLENQFSRSNISTSYWHAINNLIANDTEGVSRGIPVGPHPSHLLAELCMVPIDEFIGSVAPAYCRYVDDIHVFCRTYKDALRVLNQLAQYVDKTQKLSLSRRKTKVLTAAEYRAYAQESAVDKPINALEAEMLKTVRTYASSPYQQIKLTAVRATDLATLSQKNIEKVLEDYLSEDPVDYIRLRWFVRRLSQVGASGGIEFMVKNFSKMLPAMAEVAHYFESSTENYKGSWLDIGQELFELYVSDVVQASDYMKIVILSLFSRISVLNHSSRLTAVYQAENEMSQRKIVLAAATAGVSGWLSTLKGDYKNADPWRRRALLYSMRALPKDERKFWAKSALKRLDGLDKVIAKHVSTLK